MAINQAVASNWAKLNDAQRLEAWQKFQGNVDFLDSIGGRRPPTQGGTGSGNNNNTTINNPVGEVLPSGITKVGTNYQYNGRLFSSLQGAINARNLVNNAQQQQTGTGGISLGNFNPETNSSDIIHTAPNGKKYTINVDPVTKKATFISQGGLGERTFNSLREARNTIDSVNQGVVGNANAITDANNRKADQGAIPSFEPGYHEPLEQGKNESDEDFKMRVQKYDQYNFIADAGNYLSKFVNSQDAKLGDFTKNVQANAKALQDKLRMETEAALAEKARVQAEFDKIKSDFDANQQKQRQQIQQMETQFLGDNKKLNELQNNYYNDLTESVGRAAGGAAAGTRAQLSSLGVDEGMINTALNQVNNVYQDKLLTAKNDHITNLSKLRDAYQTFYQNMINNEGNLNTAQKDLAMLIQDKVGKYDTDITKLTTDSINAQYKPLLDRYGNAMDAQNEASTSEAKRQETEAIFQQGTPIQKAQMLYDNLARAAESQGLNFKYDTVSLELLRTAAKMPTFVEALQYIVRTAAGYKEKTGMEPNVVPMIKAYANTVGKTPSTPKGETPKGESPKDETIKSDVGPTVTEEKTPETPKDGEKVVTDNKSWIDDIGWNDARGAALSNQKFEQWALKVLKDMVTPYTKEQIAVAVQDNKKFENLIKNLIAKAIKPYTKEELQQVTLDNKAFEKTVKNFLLNMVTPYDFLSDESK